MNFQTKEDVLKYMKTNFTTDQLLICLRKLNSAKPVTVGTPVLANRVSKTPPKFPKTPESFKLNATKSIESICSKDIGIFNAFCKDKSLLAQLISLLHKNNVSLVPLGSPKGKGKAGVPVAKPRGKLPVAPKRSGSQCLTLERMKNLSDEIRAKLIGKDNTDIKHLQGLGPLEKHDKIKQGCVDIKCELPVALKLFERQDTHEIDILRQMQIEPVIVNFYKVFEAQDCV